MEKILPELEDFIENEEADKFNSKITRVGKTVLNTFAGILITSYLASSSFCILREDISRSHLISALLLSSGTCILFTTFCFKKFTITGSNGLGYLVCLLMLFESQPCQGYGDIYAMGPELRAAEWHRRLNELQGAVTTVCLVQLLVSFIDVRFLIKLIKPVSITPTLIFIGFFFMKTSAVRMAATSWTLFISTSGLMFAIYLNTSNCSNSHDRKNHRILLVRNKLYIGIFCVVLMWCLCALLSSFELIWTRSAARTDIYTGIYDYASKITIPFPFQWGVPKWKNESIYLMLPAAFITIFEILANFYKKYGSGNANAANALSNVNMLIRLEAIFCFVMSTTGVVIGLNVNAKKNCTKVLDIVSALILLMMAISGFLCAFFTTIPVPIMAALIFLLFSSAVLEGFDMLRFVDLRSVNNIFTLSTSFFMAFAIPTLIREDLEITRRPAVDHVLRCLLSTEFIVAGLTAILFDNLFAAFMGESATNDYGKISKCNSSNQEASNSSEGRESSEFCDCFSPFFA